MANPIDLCLLADVKTYLRIATSDTAQDAELARLITAASAAMGLEAGLGEREDGEPPTFKEEDYRDVFAGNGSTIQLLRQTPVRTVNVVEVDGVRIPRATSPTSGGFLSDTLAVHLRGYRFTRGIQNVAVRYSAGYAAGHPSLAALAQAAIELVALVFKTKDRVGIASETIGSMQTVSYVQQAMPSRTRALCGSFRMRVAV